MPFTGHVRKRNTKSGITTYQIIVEKESDTKTGKRERYYKTIKGSKKDAERAMRSFITELENKTFTKESKITVAEFMHQWLDLYIKNQLSPTTVQHYIDQTEKYIIPEFGNLYLQQMRNIDIQKWVFSLQEASPLTGKPLSPKTIKNIVLNLSAAMKKAVMLELIPKNPCDNLTLPKLQRFEPDVYSMEEVAELLNCAKDTDLYLPMMIEICLGLRRGELLALKWHHVDLNEGILSVEENLVTVVNKRITKTPKTKSGKRHIQIPPTLLELLKNVSYQSSFNKLTKEVKSSIIKKKEMVTMPKTYEIGKAEAEYIKELRKHIRDKMTDKKLYAVQMRGEGKRNPEIAEKLDTSRQVVSHWVCVYKKKGIEGLCPHRCGGNHRSMSYEEEEKMLNEFKEKAKSGELVTAKEIQKEYEKRIGHEIRSHGQIYKVLKRHGWRKLKPRPEHPKKASAEEIETSKKR